MCAPTLDPLIKQRDVKEGGATAASHCNGTGSIRQFRQEDRCKSGLSSGCSQRLYWFDELPEVLQYNKYVRSGYRARYTVPECACSIFQLHNETGNIHCHLIPAVTIAVMLLTRSIQPWQEAKLAFFEIVIPIILCFAGSVTYHTFMANNQNYHRWLFIDVCGVFLLFVSGTHTLMYWGLYCHPWLRDGFITAYYLAAAGCVLGGLRAKTQMQRALPMLALFGVRFLCLGTRVVLNSGSQAACMHYTVMEASSFVGAVVNVKRIPEKWFHDAAAAAQGKRVAGLFDYWLNSHQIMHVMVTISILNLWLAADNDYQYWAAMGQGSCLAPGMSTS